MSDEANGPEFAAAIGLMLIDGAGAERAEQTHSKVGSVTKKAGGMISRLLARFK